MWNTEWQKWIISKYETLWQEASQVDCIILPFRFWFLPGFLIFLWSMVLIWLPRHGCVLKWFPHVMRSCLHIVSMFHNYVAMMSNLCFKEKNNSRWSKYSLLILIHKFTCIRTVSINGPRSSMILSTHKFVKRFTPSLSSGCPSSNPFLGSWYTSFSVKVASSSETKLSLL